MSNIRNLKFNGKSGEKAVKQIDNSKANEQRSPELAHKVRRIEDVKHFKQTDANREVGGEDAGDVETADLENFFPGHLHAEEERDSNEQNREGTRMNAVKQGGKNNQRQEPDPADADLPEKGREAGTEFQDNNPQDCRQHDTDSDKKFSHDLKE